MSQFSKNISHFVLFFCVFIVLPFGAKAYDNAYFDTKITDEERAIFAFFRAADVAPDYDYWITTTDEFNSLPLKKRRDYLIKQKLRLGRGYGMFDQDKDFLELKFNIITKYSPATETKPPIMSYRFFNSKLQERPVFEFPFGAGVMVMKLNQLKNFSRFRLNDALNEQVKEKAPYVNSEFDATLNVRVRVSDADYETYAENGNMRMWEMEGEIGHIACMTQSAFGVEDDVLLWEYVAPWYEQTYKESKKSEQEKYPHPYDLFKD